MNGYYSWVFIAGKMSLLWRRWSVCLLHDMAVLHPTYTLQRYGLYHHAYSLISGSGQPSHSAALSVENP